MDTHKESSVTTIESPSQPATEASHSKPTSAETRIHWASAAPSATAKSAKLVDLEQKFEAMRARNWITERMVQQYQKHWHCTREIALERLLSKTSN